MSQQHQSQAWNLRYWILLGYAIPLGALIGSAVFTVISVANIRGAVVEVDRSALVDLAIAEVDVSAQIMSKATRGYLLDPSNDNNLKDFQEVSQRYEDALKELEDKVRDDTQKQNVGELRIHITELDQANANLLDLVKQGKAAQAIQSWKKDNFQEKADDLTKLLERMKEKQHEIVTRDQKIQYDGLDQLQRMLILSAVSSTVLSAIIGFWLISKASRQMGDSANTIASSTAEIAATVEQQERTAQQQAASVNETTTTMDELGASSRQSAEQAAAAAAGAKQALELAEGGTRAVDRTLTGMGTLREKVGAIADQIMRLSEQTSQIGSISGLVSDLANQTNMLALNAAVEAVRAGEHGKGFAVVSGEIRKLADQSKKSAEKINALVQDIQNAINSTVMATDEGTKTVEEGVRIAQETSDAFIGVTDAVNNVVLNSQQISLNVKQQAVAIQQVVSAMNNLNAAARETANGIGQVKIGTQRLNTAAGELQALV